MINRPLVYILVLNYNRWNDTLVCINSIFENDYPNYKILLIDNCSTDDSYKVFTEKLAFVELIKTDYNMGYTGGINYGLKKIQKYEPDYILIINNDTIVEKSFLSHLVNGIESDQSVAAASGTILAEHNREEIWYASGKIIPWRGLALHINKGKKYISETIPKLRYTSFISGCQILLRADLLDDIGLEDERFFMYLDDIELSVRITNKGYNLLYVPQSIIYHKVLGEKESCFKLYYSVRNRFLLIHTAFKGVKKHTALIYFSLAITYKILIWFFINRKFFKAAIIGLKDYIRGNFYKGSGELFINK